MYSLNYRINGSGNLPKVSVHKFSRFHNLECKKIIKVEKHFGDFKKIIRIIWFCMILCRKENVEVYEETAK